MISDAQAVTQTVLAHINETGSFGDYVKSLVASKLFAQFFVLMFASILGVAANYLWKWATDIIQGSLWKYLFQDHPKNTVMSFMAISGWCFVVISQFDNTTAWGIVINLGLTTGFAVDALVNKANVANRKPWTEEERAAFKQQNGG